VVALQQLAAEVPDGVEDGLKLLVLLVLVLLLVLL
jgi:hypothetical protein